MMRLVSGNLARSSLTVVIVPCNSRLITYLVYHRQPC
nr:MAG TPA: Poa1p-like protein [Caudoviricetes sp.]